MKKNNAELLLVVMFAVHVCSQPCEDFACDTTVLTSMLATMGLTHLHWEDISRFNSSGLYRSDTCVRDLILQNLGIDTLPEEVGRLQTLGTLQLQNNNLTNLPLTLSVFYSSRGLLRCRDCIKASIAAERMNGAFVDVSWIGLKSFDTRSGQ